MGIHRGIGDLLVDGGFCSRADVESALNELRSDERGDQQLVDFLLARGVIDEQVRAAVLRLQTVLESREELLDIAVDPSLSLGERLLRAGQLSPKELRRVEAGKPLSRAGWVRALLRAGYIDRGRAAVCLYAPERADPAARQLAGMRLGDLLVEHGDLDRRELQRALREQRRTKRPLGEILRRRGLVSERQINRSLRLQRKLSAAAFGTALSLGSTAALANPSGVDPQLLRLVAPDASGAMSRSAQVSAPALAITPKLRSTAANRVLGSYPELRKREDRPMERQLRRALEQRGLGPALQRGELSVALVDITDRANPRLAQIDGERMRYAASLPKIAILFGAFQKIHDGQLELTPENRRELTNMIRVSSNSAATHMLEKVGMHDLNRMLESNAYKLYDRRYDGGLWVGRAYAKSGGAQRDPLHNISHGASAVQVARYFYLLETGRLVSPEACREMKRMLGDPGIKHKFVKGLEQRPGSRIFRKSGSWRQFHADGAIVERDGRRYIAVALAESSQGGQWLPEVILAMDDVIFDSPAQRLHVAAAGR